MGGRQQVQSGFRPFSGIGRPIRLPPGLRLQPGAAVPRGPIPVKELILSNIEFDIEWTDAALKKIKRLLAPKGQTGTAPKNDEPPQIALPPIECLPAEGDVLFLGPADNRQPFIVVERQYHHEGGPDWTIVLILDLPESD